MNVPPRRYVDRQIIATSRLIENLATLAPDALTHIRTQLGDIDGHRTQTAGANPDPGLIPPAKALTGTCTATIPNDEGLGIDCGQNRPCPEHDRPIHLTTVEATVDARLNLEHRHRYIESLIKTITVVASEALTECNRVLGTRLPTVTEPCKVGQKGKDGTIDWGDPLCDEDGEKAGLCARHYMAWYRWRKNAGHDTSRMHQPPAVTRRSS